MLKTPSLRKWLLVFACAVSGVGSTAARADGCYTCGSGSSEACKNYCRYTKDDTFEARKVCEQRGCRISGKASCPTDSNARTCAVPAPKTFTSLAALPFCPAEVFTSS